MSASNVVEVLMPAPNHPRPSCSTLANGLRVSLRHAPHLKRCAAALRVAAGSHDAPLAWPGLAHFLEHLFFLGSERFSGQDGLMAYVQAQGGQVNASTRERTTDFFFELPPTAFAGGLERLCDMLAHPRMDKQDQLREREVLHAEFIAWSRDAAAQRQAAVLEGVSANHPLRAFHAGNRYSLSVPNPAFQQALEAFYRAYYHTGQMTLSLAGPQSLEELQALAEQFGGAFASGQTVGQSPAPSLLPGGPGISSQLRGRRLDLLLAGEDLPSASPAPLEFLCTWLQSSKPGGLVAELKQRRLIDGLQATPLYQFAGQALLHLEFSLSAEGVQQQSLIRQQLEDWLAFFSAQAEWADLREEFALLQQRQHQVAGALELARLDSQQREWHLTDADVSALKALLEQLRPVALDKPIGEWQLPAANPFLRSAAPARSAGLIRGQTSAHRGLRTFAQDRSRGRREASPLLFSQEVAADTGSAVIYLRWQLNSTAPQDLLPKLQQSLEELQGDARQAGVDLSLNNAGRHWILKLAGLHEPLPAILQQALKTLSQPADAFWLSGQARVDEPAPMPIRQLLKVLAEGSPAATPTPALEHAQQLQDFWAGTQWDGLAVGVPSSLQPALSAALSQIPGTANPGQPATLDTPTALHRWREVPTGSSEQAVLLFCPVPSSSITDEAAWRLLAQCCQTPFYQRLRVELQLGYGVFSGVRQINGQTGLLFGVQSPHASVAEILGHIEVFLQQLPERISQTDDASLSQQQQNLASQFDAAELPLIQAAELLWQGRLAGHPSDYLAHLQTAISTLPRPELLAQAQRLHRAEGGGYCLASAACPGSPWQDAGGSLPTLQ